MYTYEMVGLSDQNNKTYECKYGTYNPTDRFRFNDEAKKVVDKSGYRKLFDILIHDNLWKLQQPPVKKMSLKDIERELGYRVQIIDPQPEEKEVDEKHRKEVDDSINFFKELFGIDINPNNYY